MTEDKKKFRQEVLAFTSELGELLKKYRVTFTNRDAFGDKGEYLFTEIYPLFKGELWYHDTFMDLLEEAYHEAIKDEKAQPEVELRENS